MAITIQIMAHLAVTVCMAGFLWLAMKLVRVDGSFLALLLASAISIAIAKKRGHVLTCCKWA